jgi:hypothetical protein
MRVAGKVPAGYMRNLINGGTMRAETQNLIDEIKQSVTLLRRHL